MRPEPFAEVEITRDDPAQAVQAGQRGYLLEWVRHPHGGEDGAIIELHDRRDDPVVTVPQSWVRAVADVAIVSEKPLKKRAS